MGFYRFFENEKVTHHSERSILETHIFLCTVITYIKNYINRFRLLRQACTTPSLTEPYSSYGSHSKEGEPPPYPTLARPKCKLS